MFDAATGLYQNVRREYNPRLGRYMESDPIGLGGGMNTYEYVSGAPTMFVDPTGEEGSPGFPDVYIPGKRICPPNAICDRDEIDRFLREYTAPDTGGGGDGGGGGGGEVVLKPVTVTGKKEDCSKTDSSGALYNAVVGFGDAFLLPVLIRRALDIDGDISYDSTAYKLGEIAGTVEGLIPFGLGLGAELGATKFASILNKNRYFRIGPGKATANAKYGLGAGRNVPMMRIGNGKPSNWNHIDLRSRLPKIPPLGELFNSDCS